MNATTSAVATDAELANAIRALAMDAVEAAKSGHPGMPMGMAEIAVALWNRMTVEEMTALDLGYAPPFSPAWDPVLIAARKAADLVDGSR